MTERYQLLVRRPITLLEALFDRFQGDAHLSLEGDLSQCNLRRIRALTKEPIGILTRNTSDPQQDFVVFSLDAETVELLKRQVLPRVGIGSWVLHVQIERSGKLGALGALAVNFPIT